MFIENVNGIKYVWQRFAFKSTATRNVNTYCADGDGFIEVRVCNGAIGLYDQGERIRTFHADTLDQALRLAEIYADATYPTMLEDSLLVPASIGCNRARTADGYTFALQPDNTWSDGDMTFDSAYALTVACGDEIEDVEFFRI